jgi:arylsulfatase A-like enzyme
MVGHGIVVAESPWSVFKSDLLLHLIADKTRTKVSSGVPGVSLGWLDELDGQRFMAMVHLYSTHTPYDPAARFRDMYVDKGYTGPFKSFYAVHRQAIEDEKYDPSAADMAQIRDLYYAGVTQADDDIGRLVELLRSRGVLDDTLVIVLSDHGESLGEDGLGHEQLLEHDHMVQSNLRIPLVMRWPKGIPAGTRVKQLVDEIDVLPTICDLFGIALPPQKDTNAIVDGKSLVPLFGDEKSRVREYSFAENGPWIAAQDLRWKLVVPCDLLHTEWKPFTAPDDPYATPWLVDLAADPGETKNLIAEHPLEAERLLKALREFDKSMPIPQADKVLSARELAQRQSALDRLGYTGKEGDRGPRRNGTRPP